MPPCHIFSKLDLKERRLLILAGKLEVDYRYHATLYVFRLKAERILLAKLLLILSFLFQLIRIARNTKPDPAPAPAPSPRLK